MYLIGHDMHSSARFTAALSAGSGRGAPRVTRYCNVWQVFHCRRSYCFPPDTRIREEIPVVPVHQPHTVLGTRLELDNNVWMEGRRRDARNRELHKTQAQTRLRPEGQLMLAYLS